MGEIENGDAPEMSCLSVHSTDDLEPILKKKKELKNKAKPAKKW
jgi:hypothetical protein